MVKIKRLLAVKNITLMLFIVAEMSQNLRMGLAKIKRIIGLLREQRYVPRGEIERVFERPPR